MEFIYILKYSLEKKMKANPAYSLRAFARDLGVDVSNMSKIMSGKVKPQRSTQKKILLKLGYSLEDIKTKLEFKEKSFGEQFSPIELDLFETISEWYHDAILELTRLSFFTPDTKWIANTLGVSEIKIKLAVDRLERVGMLKINSSGWHDISGNNTTNSDSNHTNQALENLQISILEKSIEAIKTVPIEDRNHTSTMFTINKNDLNAVKKKIKSFRAELASFLERPSVESNELYQMHIGFYPLTKGIR